MSRVFVAQERELGRKVVIKVLPPELAAGVNIDRFRREIQLAASLQHPHIVPLLHAGHADDLLYYTMPLIEGESLRAKLAREGELPVPEAARICREVVDALAYAHGHGVVHRDIKPDNVLISGHHALVTDFGVAKALSEATGKSSLTSVGVALGTPAYMAPEQAAADPHSDHRADLYAVGALAYEMLTGRPPFLGATPQQVLAAQVTQAPEPVTQHRAAVPAALAALVMRCLEKKPADRWQTGEELLHQLEALATTSSGTTPVPAVAGAQAARGAPKIEPAKRAPAIRWLPYLGIAILAVVGSYVALSRAGAPSAPRTDSARKMLVVLPFENLGSPEDEYFADGITEEITARLASLHGLGVISRTSAIQYKKRTKPIKQIGKELGVDYVLEGTIRWERVAGKPGRVRVTPQLIRVADDTHLWASVYDAVLADIFQIQSSIAEQVGNALDVALGASERRALGSQPTKNLDAYGYYLRGNEYFNRGYAEQDLRNAVAMYNRAVRLDPGFALAYAKLAIAHDFTYWFYHDRTDQRLAVTKKAADRALALDPDLPEGHIALGWYYYHGHYDYDRALEHLAIAQQHQPNNSDVWSAVGAVQRRQGKFDRALISLSKAVELDPRSNTNAFELGITYLPLRKYREAERYFDRAVALAPDSPEVYAWKAWLHLAENGSVEMARQVLDEGSTRVPTAEMLRIGSRWGSSLLRLPDEEYQRKLAQLSLQSFGADSPLYYLSKAIIHDLRHEAQQAHAHFDSARVLLEARVGKQPGDAGFHSWLGFVYAGLGRKDAAIREGKHAVALLPISKDAFGGPRLVWNLAEIYVLVGEYDSATDQLALLLTVPSGITVPLVQHDPLWAPLRGNPRFEKLVRR